MSQRIHGGNSPVLYMKKNKNSFRVQLEIESRIGGTWTQSDFVLTSLFCSISKWRGGEWVSNSHFHPIFSETKDFKVNIWLGFWFFLWSRFPSNIPPDRFSPWLTIDFWFWLWITTSPYDWWQECIELLRSFLPLSFHTYPSCMHDRFPFWIVPIFLRHQSQNFTEYSLALCTYCVLPKISLKKSIGSFSLIHNFWIDN